MEALLLIVHYFLCVFLVVVILLQAGKGADIGAAFGAGGSQTLFGPRGAATFLNKMTAVVALLFLATSIGLVQIARGKGVESVLEKAPPSAETQPSSQPETLPRKK